MKYFSRFLSKNFQWGVLLYLLQVALPVRSQTFVNSMTVAVTVDGKTAPNVGSPGVSGGTVVIVTGTNVDVGDGSDGYLSGPTTLTGGTGDQWTVYNFRQVAPASALSPTPVMITVSGNVQINCQYLFDGIIKCAEYSSSSPPQVKINAGQTLWVTDDSCDGALPGEPCEAWPQQHSVGISLFQPNPVQNTAPGGNFFFYTPEILDVTGVVSAKGSPGQQGQAGGDGGNVTVMSLGGKVSTVVITDGGKGGGGEDISGLPATVGGAGGKGGTDILQGTQITAALITANGGNGGNGGNASSTGQAGFNGGNGGAGGNIQTRTGLLNSPGGVTANDGTGGQGGNGVSPGANGNNGAAGANGAVQSGPMPPFVPPNQWTIMVYFAADIDGYSSSVLIDQLNRLEAINLKNSPVKVVIFLDRSVADKDYYFTSDFPLRRWSIPREKPWGELWHDTRLGWLVSKTPLEISVMDDPSSALTRAVPYMYPTATSSELDTTDVSTMTSLVRYATNTAPAVNYAFVYAGHGGGWRGFNQDLTVPKGTMSFMYLSKFRAFLQTVSKILPKTKLDIFDFAGCMMQEVEVGTELTSHADFMVGTQNDQYNSVLNSAFNFEEWLGWLQNNPHAAPKDLAGRMSRAVGVGVPFGYFLSSVVDLNQLTTLTNKLDQLAQEILTHPADSAKAAMVVNSTLKTGDSSLSGQDHDLGDLLQKWSQYPFTDAQIKILAAQAYAQLQSTVIDKNDTTASGLSIYAPNTTIALDTKWYSVNAFSTGTHWLEMLLQFKSTPYQKITTDPGNSISTATPLSYASNQPLAIGSAIDTANDVDFFSFNAQAGQVIYADLSAVATNFLFPSLTLYGPDQTTVLARATNTSVASLVRIPLPSTGNYYLALNSFGVTNPLQPSGGLTSGGYALSLVIGNPANLQPHLALSTNAINFGNIANYPPAQTQVVISNSGNIELTITNIQSGSSNIIWSLPGQSLPVSLEAGAAIPLTIGVTAWANGPILGSLLVQSDDPSQPSVPIAIQATALIVPALVTPQFLSQQGFSSWFIVQSGQKYRVQSSTNLVTWGDLINFTSTAPAVFYHDATATNKQRNFYRLVSP